MLFGREYPTKQDEAFLGFAFDVEAWRFYILYGRFSIPTVIVKTVFVCLIIYKILG